MAVVSPLDQDQLAELRQIFVRFDRDRDGSITELELGSLLRSLGLKPNQEQVEALCHRADTNSNGLIEFQELVDLLVPYLCDPPVAPYTEEQMHALFRAFDTDGNGFITPDELAHSMARLGHTLTAEELGEMMNEADTDGDGKINYEEFAGAIRSAAL